MYKLITVDGKKDPQKRWALPERVFFACGACHILAHTFLAKYPDSGFVPVWIRPQTGYTGNHIVVVRGTLAFDYHGYSDWIVLLAHFKKRSRQRWPGWDAELFQIPSDVLISETKSKALMGARHREPTQFLHDATPRAHRFLSRFPAPSHDSNYGLVPGLSTRLAGV